MNDVELWALKVIEVQGKLADLDLSDDAAEVLSEAFEAIVGLIAAQNENAATLTRERDEARQKLALVDGCRLRSPEGWHSGWRISDLNTVLPSGDPPIFSAEQIAKTKAFFAGLRAKVENDRITLLQAEVERLKAALAEAYDDAADAAADYVERIGSYGCEEMAYGVREEIAARGQAATKEAP